MFRTTLEQFRAPVFDDHESDKDGWSLNTLSNIREVFGENPVLWFIPIQTHLGDGLTFPHRRAKIFTNYQSIGECLLYINLACLGVCLFVCLFVCIQ